MVAYTGSTFAKAVQVIKAGTYTATETSAAFDTGGGWGTLMISVNAGTFTSTAAMTIKVQAATTSGGSYSDITGAVFSAISTANDEACYLGSIKLDGTHAQYFKVVCTYAGSGNALLAVDAIFLLPEDSALASTSFTV
jgi:hypothetical protein